MNQEKLIEKAQQGTGSKKPADLCRATGIKSARLADLTSGRRPASNDEARRLAEVAGLNPFEVIAELEIAKAEDAATKTAWGKALASFRNSAAALLLVVCAVVAAVNAPAQSPLGVLRRMRRAIIFIMSTWRKVKTTLGKVLFTES